MLLHLASIKITQCVAHPCFTAHVCQPCSPPFRCCSFCPNRKMQHSWLWTNMSCGWLHVSHMPQALHQDDGWMFIQETQAGCCHGCCSCASFFDPYHCLYTLSVRSYHSQATNNCSLWVRFQPNWAQSVFFPFDAESAGMGRPLPLNSKLHSTSPSSMSSEISVTSTGSASCGWATWAWRWCSLSWKQAWPWLIWTFYTASCSGNVHVFLASEATGREQPIMAQTSLMWEWVRQKRSWLFRKGILQFNTPQHRWPFVMPSIPTTFVFLPGYITVIRIIKFVEWITCKPW